MKIANSLKRLLFTFIIAIFVSAGVAACGGEEEAEIDENKISDEKVAMIDDLVESEMSKHGIPGVIIGIWSSKAGYLEKAYGLSDIETEEKISIDDNVRIASNTKTYTATVILQLAEEGQISLENKLSEYEPTVPNSEAITVRQLLNMTAGIYSYSEDEEFGKVFDDDPLKVWSSEEIMEIVLRNEPNFEPGEDWHYSDTNYYLLGMIIEQVTGNAVEKEIEERIIKKLDLKNTFFPTSPLIPGKHAIGYMPASTEGEIERIVEIDPSAPWTGGAMVSNLLDLKIFVQALANGDLLSPELQKERLEMIAIEDNIMKYGLGIASVKGFLGHTGAINGYNSIMFSNPTTDATIVVIANHSTNFSAEAVGIFLGIVQTVFPETLE